ncbi:phosphatase PAP2 family protein [Variovorax sp. LT1R16]|uniref:phosphatase PAP2 family protein n=1 Tax=Variovorax sp. LT1R16 TaxID=3443728 RepID=UPI003F4776DF
MPEAPLLIALAEAAGPRAFTLFLLALAAILLASAGCVHALQRPHVDAPASDSEARPHRVVLGLAVGFASIVSAAGLFAWIALHATPDRTLGRADQLLADGIAAHLPWAALRAFGLLTHFGDRAVLIALGAGVAIILLWKRQRDLALGWLLALGGNAWLNPTLKQIFARVRPVHEHGLAFEESYSFPSGHSSGAMVVYGMLLYFALRLLPPRWHMAATLGATAVIFTTACSRIFLQVHFASDVAAGLLSGAAWLGVCVASLEWARRRRVTHGG